jgi:putative SOS response-associated peptidase YedK
MCGRYARRSDKQKIAEFFAVHGPVIPDFGPSWNVAPQTFQPVVRLNRHSGEREIVLMRWGLIPFWIAGFSATWMASRIPDPGSMRQRQDRTADHFRYADFSG